MSKLRNYFSGNRYPQYLFDNFLSEYLHNVRNPKAITSTAPKLEIFMKLPFLGFSSDCSKDLKYLISKFYPQIKLNLIFTNSNTIKNFFTYKDKIPPLLSSGVIYKYSCDQCVDTYIGETQMQLKVRICQHKGISYRTDAPYKAPTHSSIRDHAFDKNHPVKIKNFKILESCDKLDIRIVESINIHRFSPSLNEQGSSFNLSILR